MILLQSVVEILAIAMSHIGAQHRSDRARITVVSIRGNPAGLTPVTIFADSKNAFAVAMCEAR
jgi:hypothetical protein